MIHSSHRLPETAQVTAAGALSMLGGLEANPHLVLVQLVHLVLSVHVAGKVVGCGQAGRQAGRVE